MQYYRFKTIRVLPLLLAMLLCLGALSALAAEDGGLTAEAEEIVLLPESQTGEGDELFAAYVDALFAAEAEPGASELPANGLLKAARSSASSRLTGYDAIAFEKLREQIRQVAAGESSRTVLTVSLEDMGLAGTKWTAEDLGVDALTEVNPDTGRLQFTDAAKTAAWARVAVQYALVMRTLLAECPYELYWFNKLSGMKYTACRLGGTTQAIAPQGEFTFKFPVAEEFRSAEAYSETDAEGKTFYYDVDISIGMAAAAAAQNAGAIVRRYAHEPDLSRLASYRNAICDLVTYNRDAITNDVPYGNPWQLIWVFDGDAATNVVCEGYAKAFQYLCDLTAFRTDLGCILVNGNMSGGTGEGRHMWNIVTLEDGNHYLVDVTNCDSGTAGYPDKLFLKGFSAGSVEDGYTFTAGSKSITYKYDDGTRSIYDAAELTLSAEAAPAESDAEEPHVLQLVEPSEPTCTEAGRTGTYWFCESCGRYFTDELGGEEVPRETAEIPALGHAYDLVVTEPTCTESGFTTWTCSRCEAQRITHRTAPLGHDYVGEVTTPATCAAEGVMTYTCTRDAGHQYTEAIAKLAHTPDTAVRENEKAPTCTAEGSYEEVVYCAVCHEGLSRETKTLEKLSHTPDTAVRENEKAPTCTAEGSYEEAVYCAVCHTELSRETKTLAKLSHTPDTAVREKEKAATCTAEGSYEEAVYCAVCGTELSRKTKTVPLAAHTLTRVSAQAATTKAEGHIEHYVCSVCGRFFADGSGKKELTEADIVIPRVTYPEGWQLGAGGRWWYQYSDGTWPAGQWKAIGGKWYHFDGNGYMQTGWLKLGGDWYYLRGDGSMAVGWAGGPGAWYFFRSSGAMVTGWLNDGGAWYYMDGDGRMVTGWQSIGGKWYWFRSSGVMAAGWQAVNDRWYWFDASGAMKTGWLQLGGEWYYFSSSGEMVTGWLYSGGSWYWFHSSGAMAAGETVGGYTFAASGAWIG